MFHHHRIDEVLRRLDAIERAVHGHPSGCGCHDHHHAGHHHDEHHHDEHHHDEHHHHGPCEHGHHAGPHHHHDHGAPFGAEGFDEKRFVDLVVRLVAEKVETLLRDQLARLASPPGPPAGPR